MALTSSKMRILTLEYEEKRAAIARQNFKDFNVENQIQMVICDARFYFPDLYYDLIFIDAAKKRNQYFLEKFSKDKVIYGINTGFGPMAQWRIDDEHLNELQYNIIRSHSTGAGEPLPEKCVRAAMLARLMTFMQAHSGVNIQTGA